MNETDTPRSSYRELPPPPVLRPTVYRLWRQRIGPGRGGYPQRVLPDGHADLVVDDRGRAVLVGPASRVAVPELPAGRTIFGLRLAFDVVGPLCRVPAAELVDQVVPLAALLPTPLAVLAGEALAGGPGAVAARVELHRFLAGAAPPEPRVRVAVRLLWREPGVPVRRVAERVGLSERHLRRALRTEVGLGPKTFQRIARLQRFLALAAADRGRGLATLAVDAGYADQPHLSREARALAGLTATQLLAFQLG